MMTISENGIPITDLMNKEEKALDKNNFIEFADEHGIKFLEHEDLSKHTSFKIGGPAEFFVKPKNKEQVSAVVDYCEKNSVPLLPLGKGSNVLVSDNGINGVVMYFGSDFGKIELIDENTIYCEAGAGLAALCNFALENELTGLEFAYGIPGSVGGAVFMNAGAYGGEIKDFLTKAEVLEEDGQIIRRGSCRPRSYSLASILESAGSTFNAGYNKRSHDGIHADSQHFRHLGIPYQQQDKALRYHHPGKHQFLNVELRSCAVAGNAGNHRYNILIAGQ